MRWRPILGAIFAGAGVNAIVPARGGEAVRLLLAHRSVRGSTYTTLASTLLLLTLFDFAVAGGFVLWAATLGVLPGAGVLEHLESFDFDWALLEPGKAVLIAVVVLILLLILLLWFAEQIEDFQRKIAQGFAIARDKGAYLRRVALWQTVDWCLRIVALLFFLDAFGLPVTVHNALLVQVSASLATLLPLSPSGIGTEQAFILYLLSGEGSRVTLLSFSVGMRITLIVVNLLLGFAVLALTLRTVRWREHVEQARSG